MGAISKSAAEAKTAAEAKAKADAEARLSPAEKAAAEKAAAQKAALDKAAVEKAAADAKVGIVNCITSMSMGAVRVPLSWRKTFRASGANPTYYCI